MWISSGDAWKWIVVVNRVLARMFRSLSILIFARDNGTFHPGCSMLMVVKEPGNFWTEAQTCQKAVVYCAEYNLTSIIKTISNIRIHSAVLPTQFYQVTKIFYHQRMVATLIIVNFRVWVYLLLLWLQSCGWSKS